MEKYKSLNFFVDYSVNPPFDMPPQKRVKPFGGIEMNDAGQPKNLNGEIQRSLFCVGPVASFGDKYPTPHASFLVFNASDKAASRVESVKCCKFGMALS